MTTLREAAQQALEALAVATNCLDGYYIPRGKTTLPEIEDAIAALEAALAEHDKNLAGFKERKANWDIRAPRSPRDLQCKLAEETQERDRQRREYEEQRLAALAEPTLTQQMTDAGFTPRDNRLTCDECGGKFTRQMLPIHKCAALAEPVLAPAPGYCKHCKQYTIEEPLPAEPVQEQPVCDECGKHKRDGWALYCVDCVEPVFALSQPPDSKHAKEKA